MSRWLPLALALVLAWLVFGPGFFMWSQVFFGTQGVDAWGTQWFYWYVGEQIAKGQGLGHTDLLFYPWGKEVYLHTGGNVLDAFLAWPFRWVLGPVAGYNVFVLAIVAVNALAARSLAKVAGAKDPVAGIVGVLFAFNPYLLCELDGGRPTQVLVPFLLLFWADFLRLDQRPRLSWAARAGAWLALSALTYWYYALFSGVAAALYTLLGRRRALPARLVAGAVALVLVIPFALPMLSAKSVPGMLDLSDWSMTSWSPNTMEGVSIGIYSLDPINRAAGFWAAKSNGDLDFLPEATPYLRVQVPLLILALLTRGNHRRFLLTLIGVGVAIGIGPHLTDTFTNPVYYGLVSLVKVFRRLWWPQRAMVVVQVALCVATAVSLSRLWRFRPLGWAATALIGWAWIVDLGKADLAPFHFWPAGVPVAYKCLAEAKEGALIELPYAHTQAHLFYQTRHGRPIFGGMVEDNPVFSPEEQVAFRRENTFIAAIIDEAKNPDTEMDFIDADEAAVGELGYKWILIDKNAYVPPGAERAKVSATLEGRLPLVRRTFNKAFGSPVYEDEKTVIWSPWGDPSPCGKKSLPNAEQPGGRPRVIQRGVGDAPEGGEEKPGPR